MAWGWVMHAVAVARQGAGSGGAAASFLVRGGEGGGLTGDEKVLTCRTFYLCRASHCSTASWVGDLGGTACSEIFAWGPQS